jgi:aminoglycoside phosphotransferase (APT) family kinase protein
MIEEAPFASGRDADVWALAGGRVLRRYRDGWDVAAESTVMAHVRAHGYPVPVVHSAAGPDLVMDRVDGPTMLAALVGGALDLGTGAGVLADLLRRLHAVPGPGGDPARRVLHLDLHPDNVLLAPAGPVVIDWRNAAEGPPGLDVAMSAVILGQAACDPLLDVAPAARAFLRAFLHRVAEDPLPHLDQALGRRGADPNQSTRERALLSAVRDLVVSGWRDRGERDH